MEQKKQLTQLELEQLEKQYSSLTETLFQYELGMKSKDFKKWPAQRQAQTKHQFEFFKYSLNETLKVLMMHNFLKPGMADHASGNKFVTLNTKFEILKFNKRKKFLKDDND